MSNVLRLRTEYSLFDTEFEDDVKNMGGIIVMTKGSFEYNNEEEHAYNFGYSDYEDYDCLAIVDNMVFYYKEYLEEKDVHDEPDAIRLIGVAKMSKECLDRLVNTLKEV